MALAIPQCPHDRANRRYNTEFGVRCTRISHTPRLQLGRASLQLPLQHSGCFALRTTIVHVRVLRAIFLSRVFLYFPDVRRTFSTHFFLDHPRRVAAPRFSPTRRPPYSTRLGWLLATLA